MRMAQLGSAGPQISVVGYGSWEAGGMGWGPNPPDDVTVRAMRTAIEQGCNWIDSAEVYGGGRSEELVGEAIKGFDDVMVFTKVAPQPAGSGFDAKGVRAGAEGSLKRLDRDVIDLFQCHWRDQNTPIEETWEAMASLVDDGLVRYIGVSNFDRDLIERCEKSRHVDSYQPQFSLLWRDGRSDLFEFCADNGTGIIAYGPLAYGLLTGAIDADTEFGDDDWRGGGYGGGMAAYYKRLFAPGVKEKNLEIVDRLRPIAKRMDITLAQLALAWVVHQRGATGAIAGSRSPEHVAENSRAGWVELDEETLGEIESIISEH